MALPATGGGTLLPSFQNRLIEALKAEGLIPMSTGVTKRARVASNFSDLLDSSTEDVERAASWFGPRATERYSTSVGDSYRDKRFAMIASLETIKTKVYQDTATNKSVGMGFNMDKSGARDVWDRAFGGKVDFDKVYKGEASLSVAQVKTLFDHDIVYYENVVKKAAGDRPLTQNQQLALVSVAYNAPARVAALAPVIQSGDDQALMAAIMTQTFNPNHSQIEGIKARRYVEASVFAGSKSMKELMPTFDQYMKGVQVDADGDAVVSGQKVAPVPLDRPKTFNETPSGDTSGRLAELRYTNQGAKRNLTVKKELELEIQRGVTAVYGPGYRVEVMSGAQGEHDGKKSNGITGSRRHTTATAADVWVYDPIGRRLKGDDLLPLGEHWLSSNVGSVGFPARDGQSLHLDLVGGKGPGAVPRAAGEGALWYYGTASQLQSDRLNAAIAGKAPTYRISPEAVAKGFVPPNGMPSDPPVVPPRRPDTFKLTPPTPQRRPTNPVAIDPTSKKAPVQGLIKLRVPEPKPAAAPAVPGVQQGAAQVVVRPDGTTYRPQLAGEVAMPRGARPASVGPAPIDPSKGYAPTGQLAPKDALDAIRAVPSNSYRAPIKPPSMTAAVKVAASSGVMLSGSGTLGVSAMAPRTVQPVVATRPLPRPAQAAAPASKPKSAPVFRGIGAQSLTSD